MESAKEILAGEKMDLIDQLNRDPGMLRHTMQSLLRQNGTRGFCPRCGDRITCLRHALDPVVAPYNLDGVPHEATCTRRFVEEANHEC